MLKLGRIRSFDITQGRISLDDAARHEIIELETPLVNTIHPLELMRRLPHAKKILLLSEAIQVAATERQCAKVLRDGVQERLG